VSGATEPEGLDMVALQEFFGKEVPEVRGPVTAELLQGGRSNLTYVVTDGHTRWVLRRPPLGTLNPSAHDMAREYRVVAALYGSGVPVAKAAALAGPEILGVPFSVVAHVTGTVIRTEEQLHALPAADIDRCAYALIDVLAALHAVEPDSVGLADLGRGNGYLERQIKRWADQWRRVHTRELPDVDRLRDLLADAVPGQGAVSIVHGDYRIDNAILGQDDPAKILAIVDWEMATLGDPLADLGLHLSYTDPAFAPVLGGDAASTSPRLPSTGDLAQRYATTSGRDLDQLGFYTALGYFKAAVIAEGIHHRYQQGMTRGDGFDTVSQATAPLAAAGLRALSA
jgi:aminoglycoside phosphotransferase (APT) family kinase protein